MKKTILYLLLFSIFFQAKAQITLQECQAKAQQNYPLVKQYGLIEQAKNYDISNAAKGNLPQISLSAKASYQSAVTEVPVIIPGINIKGPDKDQYQISAEISQNIWDGGVIRDRKKIAKAKSEADFQQNRVDMYVLNDRINEMYFGILLLDEQLTQNRLYQEELNRHLQQITAYVQYGIANQSDIDAVEVNRLDASQKQTELETTRYAYIQMLSAFTGKKIEYNTRFISPEMPRNILLNEINRPELDLFDAENRLLESQKKSILSKNLPKLGLFIQGGYGNPGLNMLKNGFDTYYIAGIRLNWNFGNLYTQKNEKKIIETNKKTIDVQRETFLFNTRLKITQGNSEVEKYRKLAEDDDEIIRLRTRIRKAAEAKVANGTLSVTEFLREVTAEDQAKQAKAVHKTQLLMAIYNLKYTTNL
ncbi:TolC family protein [Coprobacter tertius]|uniref:TolC family protein n=1 Tax=Coprobacter tertius TaxID=2944915 RepID=A0ABT1MK37_9BACT|nr:TolC family protein [Coprobacter tertius]MCP9612988.1 TolC family protein [Coprobacter tertius]